MPLPKGDGNKVALPTGDGDKEVQCLAASLEAKLSQRMPKNVKASCNSAALSPGSLPRSPQSARQGAEGAGGASPSSVPKSPAGGASASSAAAQIPPPEQGSITLDAMLKVLAFMGASEEQKAFYTTWAELVAVTASESPSMSSKVLVSGTVDIVEHHVVGDAKVLIRLCTQWVRCCRLPADGLSHLYSVQNFIQASTMTLWCIVRSPRRVAGAQDAVGSTTSPLFDAGFSLEGPVPWRVVNRLMPFDGEFALSRDFLSYSQQEFRCVLYRGSLLPEQPEFSFGFGIPEIAGDTSPLVASPTGSSTDAGGKALRPLLAAFGFFRGLLSPYEAPAAQRTPSATPRAPGPSLAVPTPRTSRLPESQPEAVNRLKSLTGLGDKLDAFPVLPSPSNLQPGTPATSSSSSTLAPQHAGYVAGAGQQGGHSTFAVADRRVQESHIERLAKQCQPEHVQLVLYGIADGMTRASIQLEIVDHRVSAEDLCRVLISTNPARHKEVQELLRNPPVAIVQCEVDPDQEGVALILGYRVSLTRNSFVGQNFKRQGGAPAPAIIGDL